MSVLRRLNAAFWRATLSAFNAARRMAVVQVRGLGGLTSSEVEYAEPYGFASVPSPGNGVEVFGANVGAASDHPVAICVSWREERPTNLADQDVMVYDARGNQLWMQAAGITVTAPVGVTFTSPLVTIPTLAFTSLSGAGGISGAAGLLRAPNVRADTNFFSGAAPGFTGVAGPGSTITISRGIVIGVV